MKPRTHFGLPFDRLGPEFDTDLKFWIQDHISLSLAKLISRFETTQRLFWDGHRLFEPRSDDDDGTRAAPPPNCCTTPAGGRLTPIPTYNLTCNKPRRIFSGIEFRTWNPPTPRATPYH
ncbi:hypothetical protein AVEN_214685-1 [Araneus ventricosus]|uniref:Uncharacterized protein n=1 Tax=Araneus ventricosus TaxID=182803 RepID=A0A4Y2IWV1_ARAVE|nr:hypothetical protein AVEN_214685-1 [Araneus ventricosus]